jgi:O-methyltransferase
MRKLVLFLAKKLGVRIQKFPKDYQKLERLYVKFREFTMIPKEVYVDNLLLISEYGKLNGCIVECGVWRGGMSAGMGALFPDKKVYLFDSFEGLPQAKEIDGEAAMAWQSNTESDGYYDNCKAEMDIAKQAMELSGADFKLIKGWFNETLPVTNVEEPIAVLRLDGDWYDSTMDCLKQLYPKVIKGGIVILDDYHTWDGCSRALHDYLSEIKSVSRINKSTEGVAYLIKKD